MSKLKETFKKLKEKNRKAFIAYIPFGFPSIEMTAKIISVLQKNKVDIIELGIPFSDPLADGPIIQHASFEALKKGANIDKLFSMLIKEKSKIDVPIVLMSYFNPIYSYGVDKFIKTAKKAAVSAVMAVDLPCEEAAYYVSRARKSDLDTIFFVTPTTPADRIKKIASVSKGFIYYISVTGTTGPRALSYSSISKHIKMIKRVSSMPVCVGFGIHSREQVKKINSISDGAIIGSKIVQYINDNHKKKTFLKNLASFVRGLNV